MVNKDFHIARYSIYAVAR